MENYVREALKAKGLTVSEDMIRSLALQWEGFVNFRKEVQQLDIDSSHMGTFDVPREGWNHE
ncbi:MAG TPA: hypothetical protein VK061_07475 [Bacillota bacterium]|nr:hypothetical protein [Bacillota bacterium]